MLAELRAAWTEHARHTERVERAVAIRDRLNEIVARRREQTAQLAPVVERYENARQAHAEARGGPKTAKPSSPPGPTRSPPSLPPLDEATARANADALRRLAAAYGVSDLRFASPGRILGHLEDDRGLGDMALFQRDIEDLVGARADFFTDGLLDKPGVSADLLAARSL